MRSLLPFASPQNGSTESEPFSVFRIKPAWPSHIIVAPIVFPFFLFSYMFVLL